MSKIAKEAHDFIHSRAGRFIGADHGAPSLLGSHKHHTKDFLLRFGNIGGAALLIDPQCAVIIEAWDWELLGAQVRQQRDACDVRWLAPPRDGNYSLLKTVALWMLDPRRTYPMLACIPGKASSARNLALTHSAAVSVLVTPKQAITFDALKVRAAADYIEHDQERRTHWLAIMHTRAQLQGLARMPPAEQEQLVTRALKHRKIIPPEVWLPQPGSAEHEILAAALIRGVALDLSAEGTFAENQRGQTT
jgi:hypothetical protein